MDDRAVLGALALRVIEIGDANGWRKTTMESLATRLCAMQSEMFEFEEALRCDGESRLELADIAIYALRILEDFRPGDWCLRTRVRPIPTRYDNPGNLTYPMRRYARSAFESWRRGNLKDALVCVELVLLEAGELHRAPLLRSARVQR